VVDVSVEMLFGFVFLLMTILAIVEATAYWHARNVLADAAASGARAAAAFDGSCADGIAVARDSVRRRAPGWATRISVSCTDGPMTAITVTGRTPGLVAGSLGFRAAATSAVPRER
jgi:Tfp pilus assembly protein PilV